MYAIHNNKYTHPKHEIQHKNKIFHARTDVSIVLAVRRPIVSLAGHRKYFDVFLRLIGKFTITVSHEYEHVRSDTDFSEFTAKLSLLSFIIATRILSLVVAVINCQLNVILEVFKDAAFQINKKTIILNLFVVITVCFNAFLNKSSLCFF